MDVIGANEGGSASRLETLEKRLFSRRGRFENPRCSFCIVLVEVVMERGKRNGVPGRVGSRMVVIDAGGAEMT